MVPKIRYQIHFDENNVDECGELMLKFEEIWKIDLDLCIPIVNIFDLCFPFFEVFLLRFENYAK